MKLFRLTNRESAAVIYCPHVRGRNGERTRDISVEDPV